MVSQQFELATIEVEKVNTALSNEELLQLYAYYKIATGSNFESAPKPGMFDLKGKAKYNAWKKEVDAKITQADAQKKYIAYVESLKKSKGYDAKRSTKADGTAIDQAKLTKFASLSK